MKIKRNELYVMRPHQNVKGRSKTKLGYELEDYITQSGNFEEAWMEASEELFGDEECYDDAQLDEINNLAWDKFNEAYNYGDYIDLGDYDAYPYDYERVRVYLYVDGNMQSSVEYTIGEEQNYATIEDLEEELDDAVGFGIDSYTIEVL